MDKLLSVKDAAEILQLNYRTVLHLINACLLYTSPRPRDRTRSRMPSSA